MRFLPKFGHNADLTLFVVVCILLFAGFLFLASASSDIGKLKYNDSYKFLKDQAIKGLLPGIVGFLLGYFIYYRKLKKFSFFLLLGNIILLVLVFIPGIGYSANGSNRWISLLGFSFQPSELLKITFIMYLANLLSSSAMKKEKKTWKTYFLFVGFSLVVGGLILMQPATTMAVIILGAGAVVYLFNGATFKQFLVSFGIFIIALGVLVSVTKYRFDRVLPFWNDIAGKVSPSLVKDDVSVDTFHQEQSLNAIGTGGITGLGFGKSTSKYSLLPEPMGDSIFSVIAEEFGFVGSFVILILYALLFWKMTDIVQKCNDDFARLTVLGFTSVISIQTIIHIAANTGIAPYTGVPLPFISYGGTALAVFLIMMGITANISRHTSRIRTI